MVYFCSAYLDMEVHTHQSLKPFNTFGLEVFSSKFVEVFSIPEMVEVLTHQIKPNEPLLVLGGGSNMLFTQDYNGWVLKNSIKGIEIVRET